jgi:hypothetical protein
MQKEEKRQLKRMLNKGVTVAMIRDMDVTGDGDVDKMEFLCYMLVSAVSILLVQQQAVRALVGGGVLLILAIDSCIITPPHCRPNLVSASKTI